MLNLFVIMLTLRPLLHRRPAGLLIVKYHALEKRGIMIDAHSFYYQVFEIDKYSNLPNNTCCSMLLSSLIGLLLMILMLLFFIGIFAFILWIWETIGCKHEWVEEPPRTLTCTKCGKVMYGWTLEPSYSRWK